MDGGFAMKGSTEEKKGRGVMREEIQGGTAKIKDYLRSSMET